MTRLPLTMMTIEESMHLKLLSRVNRPGRPRRATDRRHLSDLQPRLPGPRFRQSEVNGEKSCVSCKRPPPLRQQVRHGRRRGGERDRF